MNDCPNLLSYGATFRMGVLIPNYPQEVVSKMNGGKTGNGTPIGTLNGIFYVNTGNGIASSTPNCTSNVFQILNDIQKSQRAVQCQYNSSTITTVPKMATTFRTTTPYALMMTKVTAKQADSVHVMHSLCKTLHSVDLQHPVHMSISHHLRFSNPQNC